MNICLCLQLVVLGKCDLGQSGALNRILMVVCDFEPVVLGLDKRKTSFPGVNFTAMRSGQRSAVCAVSAL